MNPHDQIRHRPGPDHSELVAIDRSGFSFCSGALWLLVVVLFIFLCVYTAFADDSFFAPSPKYDRAQSVVLGYYSTTTHRAIGVTTSTAGVMYKSNTRSRATAVKRTIPVGTTVIGIHPLTKFVIYSGVTGTVERQPR